MLCLDLCEGFVWGLFVISAGNLPAQNNSKSGGLPANQILCPMYCRNKCVLTVIHLGLSNLIPSPSSLGLGCHKLDLKGRLHSDHPQEYMVPQIIPTWTLVDTLFIIQITLLLPLIYNPLLPSITTSDPPLITSTHLPLWTESRKSDILFIYFWTEMLCTNSVIYVRKFRNRARD